MKLISDLHVTVNHGQFPQLVDDIYQTGCEVISLKHVGSQGDNDDYIVQILYKEIEKLKLAYGNLNKKKDSFKITSIANTLENQLKGGLLRVVTVNEIKSDSDYELNIEGAQVIIEEKIKNQKGYEFSSISRSIGLIYLMKEKDVFQQQDVLTLHSRAERDAAVFSLFAQVNPIPQVITFTQMEDVIKTLSRIQYNFSAIRIIDIEEGDIFTYDQISKVLDVPVVSNLLDEEPLYILTVINKLMQKHSIDLTSATFGFMGIDLSTLRLTRLLERMGCHRVLGYDSNERMMLGFENQGGLGTTAENIFSNADVIIICKDNFTPSDLDKIRPGQFVISFVQRDDMTDDAMRTRGVREFIQKNRNDILKIAPGFIMGLMAHSIKQIEPAFLIKIAEYLCGFIEDDYTFPGFFSDLHQKISDSMKI
jgi:hypothetical protein